MTKIDQCPYKTEAIHNYPNNVCTLRGNYCNWPCEPESCDTYKSHIKIINMLLDIADRGTISDEPEKITNSK